MRRVLACLLASMASVAGAQEGVYVGIGFGEFDFEETFVDPVFGRPVGDTVDSYKLFGGFEINQYFAIEVSYGKDDSSQQSVSTNIPPYGDVFYLLDIDFTKTAVRAVGQLPLGSVVLLAGLGYASTEEDVTEYFELECCGAGASSTSFSDDGMMAQLGVEWRLGRFGTRYAFRLEYEWWDIDGLDSSTVGLAFSYGF
jgi:hypothetical protein